MKTRRIIYAICFLLLFLTEVYIALYVHDDFIRPYIGDVLVTMLICCFCRIFIPKGLKALPLYVMIFSFLVETAQYFRVIYLLGLENSPFFCTIIGTSFSHIDLVCYAVGCLLFWTAEKAVIYFLRKKPR
jgi:hypothetical protein